MNRRGFLHGILAAGMAPAIVKAEILMPVRKIIVPPPILTGEIGQLYGMSIISSDHVIDSQRYFNEAWRSMVGRALILPAVIVGGMTRSQSVMDLHKGRPVFIPISKYESLLKGHA